MHSLESFKPHPLIKSGMLQTYFASLCPGRWQLSPTRIIPLTFSDGDKVLLHIKEANASTNILPPVVLFLHGLGGSSEVPYLQRIAAKLNIWGCHSVRFNHRGCGPGGNRLASSIYHAGRIDDLHEALLACSRIWPKNPLIAVGFSLSGNMLLRYLGEQSKHPPPNFQGALAVCPPIDLYECANALAEHKNILIDRHYTQLLKKSALKRQKLFPSALHPKLPKKLDLKTFDSIYTAPLAGFKDRLEYYQVASSFQHLSKISHKTTIIATKDDPIIPFHSFTKANFSPTTELTLHEHGGHMGFIAETKTSFGDHRWMDAYVIDWLSQFKKETL